MSHEIIYAQKWLQKDMGESLKNSIEGNVQGLIFIVLNLSQYSENNIFPLI